MQRNKVNSVTTINQVAKDLGVDVDVLHDITLGLEPEDGVIWLYGLLGNDAVMAFTDDGIDEVKHLLEMHGQSSKASPRT